MKAENEVDAKIKAVEDEIFAEMHTYVNQKIRELMEELNTLEAQMGAAVVNDVHQQQLQPQDQYFHIPLAGPGGLVS